MSDREFFQSPPALANTFDSDPLLRSHLARLLPADVRTEIEPGLHRLGHCASTEMLELAREAEASPPRHVPYDAWGRRIDHIETSRAWKMLDRIAAEEGIVATAYERAHGAHSRVHQMSRLYLYNPSSAIYSCPLAMTDGAARAIELYGDAGLKERAYSRLISRDPSVFWTSGQWMTERTGGSDVGGTSTVARRDEQGGWRLHGTKWFTSATTSQMAMTLARIEGAPTGSRGLSLFYLELRTPDGALDQIRVHRLKDKLGTKALPTAELTLEGTRARLVGGEGDGVRKISSLFNITRIYNAVCAVSGMRRGLTLAKDYAKRRTAFGKLIAEQPAHIETLAMMETEVHAAMALVFRAAELLGRDETRTASADEQAVLRLLTPLVKLFTAKQGVAVASEALEAFGGAGYVEDTGLPVLLRDSQVLAIWEGTTNVLALDALRAIEKENALGPFVRDTVQRARGVRHTGLEASAARVLAAAQRIPELLASAMAHGGTDAVQSIARSFAMGLARTYAGALLLEHADWCLAHGDARPAIAARRWCARDLLAPGESDATWREESVLLAE